MGNVPEHGRTVPSNTSAPPGERVSVRLAEEDLRRLRVFMLFFSAWIVVNLVLDLVYFLPRGDRFFLVADVVVLVCTLAASVWQRRHRVSAQSSRAERVVLLYSSALLVWAAAVSAYQVRPYTIMIVGFVVAAHFVLPPYASAVRSLLGFAAFLGFGSAFGMALWEEHFEFTLEAFGLLVATALVSLVLRRSLVARFTAEDQLRDTVARQEQALRDRTASLQERLSEREVLLREVHHRVKNNLQILASLFRLERAYHPENADATVLRAASNRILAMALVHRQLYESASLEQVDLSKYLGTLTDNVVHSYWDKGGLRIDKRLTPCWVPLDTAINVGLMATEVLSNACIHAFPDPGGHELISIDLSLDQDVATVVVSDNGRGMEASHFEPGTHGLAGGGLGLLLVHRLADQMDARLAWRADGGTTVQFSFSCS